MSPQRFHHDLVLATQTTFENVANIRKGDLNDGIAFAFHHHHLESPVDVQVVIHSQSSSRVSERPG